MSQDRIPKKLQTTILKLTKVIIKKGGGSTSEASDWHSDNELNAKGFPPLVIKHDEESRTLNLGRERENCFRGEKLRD